MTASKPRSPEEIQFWIDRLRRSPAIQQSWLELNNAADEASRHIIQLPRELQATLLKGKNMLLAAVEDQIQEALYNCHTEIVVS